MDSLPLVDVHSRVYAHPKSQVWDALQIWIHKLTRPAPRWFVTLWDLEPISGFATEEKALHQKIVLRGQHRFSRYELCFTLTEEENGIRISAQTAAEFPGLQGGLYRAVVIGSGGHTFVVQWVLRSIEKSLSNPPTAFPRN